MKILFYFENRWVFGKIHNELIKVLYPEIYCDILDASVEITSDKMALFLNKYDYIVTTPWAGICVLNKLGGIPLDKIIGIAHGDLDIAASLRDGASSEDFDNLAGYATISDSVANFSCKQTMVKRIPKVLKVGLFTELYQKKFSEKIKTLGYVGCFERIEDGRDIKRGILAKQVAEKTGLEFKHIIDINFLTIEQMYDSLDLIMFCSLTEGNPYSAIEAFACGIPVIGTDTGIFEKISHGSGFIVPNDEKKFINSACKIIKRLKSNHDEYLQLCKNAKLQSLRFDWKYIKDDWINYFLSIKNKLS